MPDDWHCPKCRSACSDLKHKKEEAKRRKERRSRSDQARVIQSAEDAIWLYAEWENPKKQSSGNGNSAGVDGVKIVTLRSLQAFTFKFLEDGRAQAIEEDREAEWVSEVHEYLEWFLAKYENQEPGEGQDPGFEGLWCEPADKRPCRRNDSAGNAENKRCLTHCQGDKTHIQCRKERLQTAFFANKPGSKKRVLVS